MARSIEFFLETEDDIPFALEIDSDGNCRSVAVDEKGPRAFKVLPDGSLKPISHETLSRWGRSFRRVSKEEAVRAAGAL